MLVAGMAGCAILLIWYFLFDDTAWGNVYNDRMDSRATSNHYPPSIRVRYLSLGTVALLFLGLVYAWSIFAITIEHDFGWSRASLGLTFSISMAFFCIGSLLSSFLLRRYRPRVCMVASGCTMCIGFALTALFASEGIWAVYFFYGVFCGVGCGLGYNSIIATVSPWFPGKSGLASGVLLMGYGSGTLVLGTLAGWGMIEVGWQPVFLILAVVSLVVMGIASAVLKPPPSVTEEAINAHEVRSTSGHEGESTRTQVHTIGFLLTDSALVLFILWRILGMSASLALIGDSGQGAIQLGVSADNAIVLVGFVSAANGLGRIAVGLLYDRVGLVKSMVALSVTSGVAVLLLCVAFQIRVPLIYVIGALLMGIAFGGFPVMSSTFALDAFNPKDYPLVLALSNSAIIPGSIVSGLISSFVRTPFGDVAASVAFLIVVCAAFAVLLIFIRSYRVKQRG